MLAPQERSKANEEYELTLPFFQVQHIRSTTSHTLSHTSSVQLPHQLACKVQKFTCLMQWLLGLNKEQLLNMIPIRISQENDGCFLVFTKGEKKHHQIYQNVKLLWKADNFPLCLHPSTGQQLQAASGYERSMVRAPRMMWKTARHASTLCKHGMMSFRCGSAALSSIQPSHLRSSACMDQITPLQ